MKRISLILVFLTLAFFATAQVTYNIEKGIHYHADAGEYAAERCVLDFYYPVGVKDFLPWYGSTAEVSPEDRRTYLLA